MKKILNIVAAAFILAHTLALHAQDLKEKFSAAQTGNATAMRQHTWKSRTELKLKGESKNVKLEQLRYDVNGQLQKTPLSTGSPQPPQPRVLPGGRLKEKIIEKKKEEVAELIHGLADLVSSYSHLPQDKLRAIILNALFRAGQGADANTIEVTGQNVLVPGDSLSLWVNKETMLLHRVAITTVYENKPAKVACNYAKTPGGLNYMAKAVLDYPSENIQVMIDNYVTRV